MKRKIMPDPVLMIVSVIAITGFQLYWLRNNYHDAQRNLNIQTNVAFQETVRDQHIKTLGLNYSVSGHPNHPGDKILFFDKHITPDNVLSEPRDEEIVTTVNALREKVADSIKVKNVVITAHESSNERDTGLPKLSFRGEFDRVDTTGKLYKIVLDLDSLKDTINLPKLTKAYGEILKHQNISVPFSIVKLPKVIHGDEAMSFATVGIAHPVTYQLVLGNTFPYLLERIAWPILFSVFLVGITIFSFWILYNNLLRQQRLSAIKNEFISNITHELKTPIATVGVAIEALKSFNAIHDEQKTKEYLDISTNELQRLSLLVDKVLKLSMFEKKELELKPENINLTDVVSEVIASMRLQIEKHHAKVALQSEGDTTLTGDRMHLQSVIFNLLDNALKYSRDEPVIDIHLKEKENKILLSIADTGIGIASEYRNKIFEKFFRVPMGDTHDAKGYGLGLSYVAQIVELHQGTIDVESTPGEGTTFLITLPKTQV